MCIRDSYECGVFKLQIKKCFLFYYRIKVIRLHNTLYATMYKYWLHWDVRNAIIVSSNFQFILKMMTWYSCTQRYDNKQNRRSQVCDCWHLPCVYVCLLLIYPVPCSERCSMFSFYQTSANRYPSTDIKINSFISSVFTWTFAW